MVKSQIDHALSQPPVLAVLANFVHELMKRAIETRKRDVHQQRESNIYTLRIRESLETYRQINSAIVTLSALGTGFTFAVIFSNISEPRTGVPKGHANTCLAVAWLLFVTAILLASFASAVRAMRENAIINSLFVLRIVQGSLVLGAFVASAEAVRSYQAAIGIIAFGVIGAFGVIELFASLLAKMLFVY